MVYNVAAIAAAHAMNTKNTDKTSETTTAEKYHYYQLVIKKFFKFPVIKKAICEFPNIKTKTINSQTLWVSQHWIFHDAECDGKPSNYVNENLDRYLTLGVWDYLEKDVFNKYLDGVKADYGVTLDKSELIYTTKTAWVVDIITEDDRVEILSSNK
jgi:hypothetical protein